MEDSLWAGLTDSHAGLPMGGTAENLAEKVRFNSSACLQSGTANFRGERTELCMLATKLFALDSVIIPSGCCVACCFSTTKWKASAQGFSNDRKLFCAWNA